jgi:hypothetical protein
VSDLPDASHAQAPLLTLNPWSHNRKKTYEVVIIVDLGRCQPADRQAATAAPMHPPNPTPLCSAPLQRTELPISSFAKEDR